MNGNYLVGEDGRTRLQFIVFRIDGKFDVIESSGTIADVINAYNDREKLLHITRLYPSIGDTVEKVIEDFSRATGWKRI